MKGTDGKGRAVSEVAYIGRGWSDRGVGIQTAVYMPGAEEMDGACVYMTRLEAIGFWGALAWTIIQSVFVRPRPPFGQTPFSSRSLFT